MKVPAHLQIERIKLAPGQEWADASPAWRFVRLVSGAAYWFGGAETRPLAEGEVVLAAPALSGVVRASQIGEAVVQFFYFAPDLLCGLLTAEERRFFEPGGAREVTELQFLPSTHPVARQFAALGGSTLEHPGLARRLEVLGLAAAVFDEELARQQPPSSLGASALQRFQQIVAQMPDTEMVNHSPDELAHLCGCSARHFNRLFRKHFGTSTRAWQTELRLLKARQLLTHTEEKVIQVALDSGYRNLSLFNFLFKRRFGMTPSDWRRKGARQAGNGSNGAKAAQSHPAHS